jgi:predicted transcriptional regulator
MKKVTVYLADETVEILDKLARSREYYKYPKYQAYGILIDEMLLELQQIAIYSARLGFSI